jgi:hypothetical protein
MRSLVTLRKHEACADGRGSVGRTDDRGMFGIFDRRTVSAEWTGDADPNGCAETNDLDNLT